MKTTTSLVLIALTLAACAQPPAPVTASRDEQFKASLQALEARDDARNAAEARQAAIDKAQFDAAKPERDHAALVALEAAKLIECTPELRAQQARMAAWEARRSLQLRLAAERTGNEAWARNNCRWVNTPRTRIEVSAHREDGETVYEANDRFAGFSQSVPICPKGTSPERLQAAADIANQLTSGGRVVRDGAGEMPLYFGKQDLQWCAAHQPAPAATPPPADAPSPTVGF
jgi:hypothetical protein